MVDKAKNLSQLIIQANSELTLKSLESLEFNYTQEQIEVLFFKLRN